MIHGRMLKKSALLLFYCCFSALLTIVAVPLVAAEEMLELKLIEMKAEALTEENGEEVYISVSKYSNMHPSEDFRIPSAPNNWFFNKLDEAKNITLWRGKLDKDEILQLVVSVAEADFPPWDVDDLVGTVAVNLKESHGRLVEHWEIPKMDGQPKIEDKGPVVGNGRRYILHGDNSRYEVELVVVGHR